MDSVSIGKSIKTLRDIYGISQQQLARQADIAQSTLSYVESGKKSPTCETLSSIADGLGVTLYEVIKLASDDPDDPPEAMLLAILRINHITAEDLINIIKAARLLYHQFPTDVIKALPLEKMDNIAKTSPSILEAFAQSSAKAAEPEAQPEQSAPEQ